MRLVASWKDKIQGPVVLQAYVEFYVTQYDKNVSICQPRRMLRTHTASR